VQDREQPRAATCAWDALERASRKNGADEIHSQESATSAVARSDSTRYGRGRDLEATAASTGVLTMMTLALASCTVARRFEAAALRAERSVGVAGIRWQSASGFVFFGHGSGACRDNAEFQS